MSTQTEVVGVVGAGLMGAEIALVYALAGHRVILNDRSDDILAKAKARLATLLEKGAPRGFWPADAVQPALDRIETNADLAALKDADFVTEAVFESFEVKQAVMKQLNTVCRTDCVIASNTSTIPISTLAAEVDETRRGRFIGTHYFSPVSRMKLVEIIPAFDTTEETVEFATRLATGAGKTAIRVKDVAGFAVNRVLHAFLIEAIRLVDEGVATPADIDAACRLGLGHSMGPFELMDAVTSSLTLQVQDILHDNYGERFRPPALLRQRVTAGMAGGRGKRGWRT
jgi:3-hydroxybutyryl-CoA dehydrogenase